MKINIKTLVLSSVAFCATAAFAATNNARVDVPFNFTAKGHTYPAGTYNVAFDANDGIVALTSQADAAKHIEWTTGPADEAKTKAVVRFDQTGTDYALKNVQLGAHVTPNLDKPAKHGVSATTSIGGQ